MTESPLTWSKSQFATFQECARKHAFSHWETTEIGGDPQWKEARRLKKLSNRFLWPGAIVHEEIGRLLKRLQHEQPIPALNDVLDECRTRMRTAFQESQANREAQPRFFEHEYNITLSKASWSATWALVENCLKRFTQSAWFERLKGIGPESWKAVDEILSFSIDEVKAYVKIDCALEIEGSFILIDWKTSSLRPTDGPSLNVAALYAHEVWSAEPAAITAHAVCLSNGMASRYSFDEDILMETYLKVQQESAHLSGHNKLSNPFDLPFPERMEICDRCNFKQLCLPGGQRRAI